MHPRRKSLRLKGYDYSRAGWYFVTINVGHGQAYFGNIVDDRMIMNPYGQIVANQWVLLSKYYDCKIDEFIVMPNHFHGIIEIKNVGAAVLSGPSQKEGACGQAPVQNLSFIIRAFKLFSAKNINALKPTRAFSWHRSFYERIIRNERELNGIRKYIINNPKNWALDGNNISD